MSCRRKHPKKEFFEIPIDLWLYLWYNAGMNNAMRQLGFIGRVTDCNLAEIATALEVTRDSVSKYSRGAANPGRRVAARLNGIEAVLQDPNIKWGSILAAGGVIAFLVLVAREADPGERKR